MRNPAIAFGLAALLLLIVLGIDGHAHDDLAPDTAPLHPPAAPVARIVFVDQAECCECTRRSIDGTWAALQQALAKEGARPVERISIDRQPSDVRPYLRLRTLVALPALYFLAADGSLVGSLQGPQTTERLAILLGKPEFSPTMCTPEAPADTGCET